MWAFIFRRLVTNIPVFLGILLLVMLALRVNDPVFTHISKNPTQREIDAFRHKHGLDQPFYKQYFQFVGEVVRFNFQGESWDHHGETVGEVLRRCAGPSAALAVPSLILTTLISIGISLISAFYRGRPVDRTLVFVAVMGMSVSFLVYVILGQYVGAFLLNKKLGFELFAIEGYKPGLVNWPKYCLLPVSIAVLVGIGYDTRFYRAVMVEESNRDYITTAKAKGATRKKIMYVHMLKNAMIQIITRVVVSLPFLIAGSILEEKYFGIPGMGRELIYAVINRDFPIIQAFTAVIAALYIVAIILTDICYALVDPRVRLS